MRGLGGFHHVERWERDFGGRRLRSAQSPRGPGHISERFWPFTFDVALKACPDRLVMRVSGWRIGPLPLPAGLAPRSAASEDTDADGRFRFDIAITLPLIGRLVRYRGWLRPDES
ncbi:MAG: hypothetical protein BGP06_06625 [Rhizobiales bacterium 65-9]|nr:MAG: hypothetical protein BGP06_06625 [Rhizobiales bacterium 65-9]